MELEVFKDFTRDRAFHPGQGYSFTAEQIVGNPVPRRGFGGGLHGSWFTPRTEFFSVL